MTFDLDLDLEDLVTLTWPCMKMKVHTVYYNISKNWRGSIFCSRDIFGQSSKVVKMQPNHDVIDMPRLVSLQSILARLRSNMNGLVQACFAVLPTENKAKLHRVFLSY